MPFTFNSVQCILSHLTSSSVLIFFLYLTNLLFNPSSENFDLTIILNLDILLSYFKICSLSLEGLSYFMFNGLFMTLIILSTLYSFLHSSFNESS